MTPLLAATLAFASGVLAGLRVAAPMPFACAAIVMLVLAVASARRRVVLVAFAAAGAALGAVRAHVTATDCRALLTDGARVELIAYPLVQPLEGASVLLRASALRAGERACGDVQVRASVHARHIALLDSAAHGHTRALHIRGRWLAYAKQNGWPRKPQFSGTVLIDAVSVAGDTRGADRVTRFRTAQQQRLRALLPERWGLAESLLLAQTAGIDQETRARWVAAGLVHVLAISGMHVGLIATGVLVLCSALGFSRRTAGRAALLISAAYVLFLGAPSAALRALLQAGLLLCSLELQRPAEPFTALAAAALAIMLVDPIAIIDPGFQLSFAGMIGLVAWRRPLMARLPVQWPRYLRDGMASGVAASALTTPVAALHFGTASWIGIPATIVAAPVVAAAIGALLLALVIAACTGVTAGVHATLADALMHLLDIIAEGAARVPGGHGPMSAHTVLITLAAAASAIIVMRKLLQRAGDTALPPPIHATDAEHAAFARRHSRQRLRIVYASACALIVVAWGPLLLRPWHDGIEIHAIDVGQGDAYAIRTPKNQWILVDAGPRTPRRDAGSADVVPYLLARGVRRLDALILTHPDGDHIGGAAAVMEAFDVGVVIDPGLAAGKDMFIDLLHAARDREQRWVAARAGIVFNIDELEVTLLFPFQELDASADANDNSVVFRLAYGGFSALFTGDAPMAVEEELVARHGARLRATMLKVGHHGSVTSTSDSLLVALRPSVAVVSAGRNNRYGHPAASVMQRLQRHGVRVLRTDEHGDITMRAYRDGRIEVLTR
jgi:competence protein ComEC